MTLLRTMKYFDRNKYNHFIVTILPPGSLFPQFKKTGINIQCLNMKNCFDVFALFKYINILKKKKPEIVVAYLFHALTFAVIGKILYPKNLLIHYKCSITFASRGRDMLGKFYKFFVNYLIGASHGVIASESKTRFRLGLNSYVVYNGIELPQVPLRKKTSSKKAIIIGTVTRLNEAKGLTYLLESAKELKTKKYQTKFVIVGGGKLLTKLKKMIIEMRLEDTVELKGESMNVESHLEMFDIFVLPSLYEGFGNVFIEAMSYLIPVIGTNVSGINEIIKDNVNGLLVKPKSAEEITRAIVRLIEDPALREKLGREGRKTVERHFTIQQTYYYAITAFDYDGNESDLSYELAYDTPRPEGYNEQIFDYTEYPDYAGWDFSTYSVVAYDNPVCDFYYGYDDFNEAFYFYIGHTGGLIQDFGYTESLDEITYAPEYGWSSTGIVEAILGHTYIIWTWDNHFAKFRVSSIGSNYVVFDWAYQVDPGNPELVIGQ
ncbi:D-inositol-3-phosphate glycosyltransferase [subsurface metagenome]